MYLLLLADTDPTDTDPADAVPTGHRNSFDAPTDGPAFDALTDPVPENTAFSPLFAMAVLAHLGPRPWTVSPAA